MYGSAVTDVMFLPGIVAPAEVRYRPLLDRLPTINAVLKDLEVYASERPAPGYSTQDEVDAIEAVAVSRGLDRFHLYAHSGGGACALAYVAQHPERLLSLAVDEPATDFTAADHADPYWKDVEAAAALTGPQAVLAFLRIQVAPGVNVSPPPDGSPPPWMEKRPLGMRTFAEALRRHRVDTTSYSTFRGPVLFTFGSLTHPRWRVMRDPAPDDVLELQVRGIRRASPSEHEPPGRTGSDCRPVSRFLEPRRTLDRRDMRASAIPVNVGVCLRITPSDRTRESNRPADPSREHLAPLVQSRQMMAASTPMIDRLR